MYLLEKLNKFALIILISALVGAMFIKALFWAFDQTREKVNNLPKNWPMSNVTTK